MQTQGSENPNHAQVLCEFALEREDVKWLVENLPGDGQVDVNTAEYELQLLKIVSTGWAISFYLQEDPLKDILLEPYWQSVRAVSGEISQAVGLLTGQDTPYFQIVRERLDSYVQAMTGLNKGDDPSQAMGAVFALHCQAADNPFAVLTGAKLFAHTLRSVREYLQAVVDQDAAPPQ